MTKPEPAPFAAILAAPFGALGVRCGEDWVDEIVFLPPAPEVAPGTPLAAETVRQLRAYLANPDSVFSLPLRAGGTAFQQAVWQQICAIPRGETATYGQVAARLGSAARAVGGACRANPLPLVVPCHRVVATGPFFNGGLGGFAGARRGFLPGVKHWLLRHEGVIQGDLLGPEAR